MKNCDDVIVERNAPYSNSCKAVLVGIGGLTLVPLSQFAWNAPEDETMAEVHDGWLSLKEIGAQLKSMGYGHSVFYVWVESPLHGVMYQFGNYGDIPYWIEHGEMAGYA